MVQNNIKRYLGGLNTEETFTKVSFNSNQTIFDTKLHVTPVEEDIYYDEIIYYDGGDAKGYGYS